MPQRSQKIQGIGFLLHDVSRLMRQELNRRAAPLGLTQAQWQVLAYLSQHEGVSQVTVAEYFAIAPITLARVVDRLEDSGWVERQRNPADGRAVQLFLTQASGQIVDAMWEVAHETREHAMQGLSDDMRSDFVHTLKMMKRNLCASRSDDADASDGSGNRNG